MNGFLLGQNLGELLLPLLFLVVYGVVHALRHAGENKKAPPPARRPPPRPVRPEMQAGGRPGAPQDPRLELDRFLEELGVKPAKPQAPPPPAKPNRRERARPRATGAYAESTAPAARASQRRFQSQLEERHADAVHSPIETQHVEVHVKPVAPSVVAAASAPAIARTAGDVVLHRLLEDRPLLARAMILGTVLGSPVGFGPTDRRV